MKRIKEFTESDRERYTEIWDKLKNHYDEKDRRLLASAMSLSLGYGGNKVIREITKLNPDTLKLGIEQLTDPLAIDDKRMRRVGGGRKSTREVYPEIEEKIINLVETDTQGDPESPLLWTSKSLENIKKALEQEGYSVSLPVISEILSLHEYSMRANKRRFEGATSEIRNSQFEYINKIVKDAFAKGTPVISVDGKKKENVGNYDNKGREHRKKGKEVEVNAYDFADKEKGKVTPYGIYDIARNNGWVNVGCDHDTAEFSVYSIRQWWLKMGKEIYPDANELVISADGGGSNSSVSRLWKVEIQRLCDDIHIPITVCHFPPGTSKWNTCSECERSSHAAHANQSIEHRMFSAISMNWRGRPLVSHEVIINLISATTNKSGLKIYAELDTHSYKKGIKILDSQFSNLNIHFHETNPKLNYTIYPLNTISIKL